MDRHSSTAAAAPSMAAAPTAPMVPAYIPYPTDSTTIPVQIHAIAMYFCLLLFPKPCLSLCIPAKQEKHAESLRYAGETVDKDRAAW